MPRMLRRNRWQMSLNEFYYINWTIKSISRSENIPVRIDILEQFYLKIHIEGHAIHSRTVD
jgi:hypothetical protein